MKYFIKKSLQINIILFFFTTNLLSQWQPLHVPANGNTVNCVAFNINTYNDTTIYTSASSLFSSTLYTSNDYGDYWNPIWIGQYNYPINSIYLIDSSIYLATGHSGSGGPYGEKSYGAIYLSSDGGMNWAEVVSMNERINTIIVDSNYILAGTHDNGLYISTDKGLNWSHNAVNVSRINSIKRNGSNFYMASYQGLFFSSDIGSSWQKLAGNIVYDVAFNGSTIYYGSYDGVYKSKDSGKTFDKIWNKSTNSIAFYENNIYTSGQDGLFVSYNEGVSWSVSPTWSLKVPKIIFVGNNIIGYGSESDLYSISISNLPVDVNEGYNEIPTVYLIEQNYPNPFNPTTTIKYDIPTRSNVKIDVFDVLGREIETLVNKELDAGNYRVSFNASGLNSGIYFYRMQAGNFVKTKKFVLMK